MLGWVVHQVDVSQAFLYGLIDRAVYMHQPPGHQDGTGRVCKLRRALYGLKQAPRIWSEHLQKTLLEAGFTQSPMDPALYSVCRDGVWLYILDWVDDILIGSISPPLIEWFKGTLRARYKIKDLGVAEKYIGMSVYRDPASDSLWLHQAYYCLEMLEKYGLVGRRFPDTPLPDGFVLFHPWETLSPDGDLPLPEGVKGPVEAPLPPVLVKRYQQIVGSLNYAAHCTRFDVAYAVSQLSRASQKPRARHLEAAEHCVRYLAGTADWGLRYSGGGVPYLEAYCDASPGSSGSPGNMTGMILKVAGGPVSWSAKKQERKTTSTCDSESLATVSTCHHVEHMRDLLVEFHCMQMWPTPLYNDNSAAVKLSEEPRAHHRSIHLTRTMAAVRKLAHDGVIAPLHLRTADLPADFLTKNTVKAVFERCRVLSGLAPLPRGVSLSSPPCGSARGSVGSSSAVPAGSQ